MSAEPADCSMGDAVCFWANGPAWYGADEACECQDCAGHRWTRCHECGRRGDRAGDDASVACHDAARQPVAT